MTTIEMIKNLAQRNSVVASADVLAVFEELEVKDKHIAELEAQVKVWESAATKHLARAEEAEKRLATPVRLPRTLWYEHDELPQEIPVLEKENVVAAIRTAGFKVEGDE
ncbi:hypothetical protein [Serratia marcescens]|uniref:Uncharacterized protein n=1 Tax=Serratia marcescens TaxID=615 RepID=A0A9X8VER1_SERMA|nr:hypothetical protein [Serratia marcescens]MBS3895055.1 hypothetical protein [Serratia marcescens]